MSFITFASHKKRNNEQNYFIYYTDIPIFNYNNS